MTPAVTEPVPRPARDVETRLAVRESFVLPALFLTVVLAGGFRAAPGGGFHFALPPLVHLVLAVLVLSVLVRSGAFAPERILNAGRAPVENVCGLAVLLTLFLATAQALNAVTPDAGLLQFVFVVFFALLLWNTLTMQPDAPRARRSLLLVFGAALVFRYVVIEALYAPDASLTKRVLTTLLEGATLGGLHYAPTGPATGYVAFVGLALYFTGILLLPAARTALHGGAALDRQPHGVRTLLE